MKPREIVEQAFDFQQTDVVPYWLFIEAPVEKALNRYYGSHEWQKKIVPYLYAHLFGAPMTETADGRKQDAFGSILESGAIDHLVQPVLQQPDLDTYCWPTAASLEDWDHMAAVYKSHSGSYRIGGLAYGLFERAWMMRGMQNVLMDMLDRPDFVHDLLDGILKIQLDFIDLVAERIPVDAYFAGDDWSDQRGPMMGIRLWRTFIKPRFARLIERCHEHGLTFICHSCGNVLPLIDDLLEIGLDGLESLQPEAMDVYELKKRSSGKMVLIGGMGTQSTLPHGTPRQVIAETKKLMRELGRGGGYVISPAKPMQADTPVQNAVALIETVTAQ